MKKPIDTTSQKASAEKPTTDRARPAHDETKRTEAENTKATQFDGSGTPEAADRSTFKPRDDTPQVLEKKSGPRTGRA